MLHPFGRVADREGSNSKELEVPRTCSSSDERKRQGSEWKGGGSFAGIKRLDFTDISPEVIEKLHHSKETKDAADSEDTKCSDFMKHSNPLSKSGAGGMRDDFDDNEADPGQDAEEDQEDDMSDYSNGYEERRNPEDNKLKETGGEFIYWRDEPPTGSVLMNIYNTAPKTERNIYPRMMQGERFLILSEGLFYWNKTKCQLRLSQDLHTLLILEVRGGMARTRTEIDMRMITNVSCVGMLGVSLRPPPEFKDRKVLSLVVMHENQPSNPRARPRSRIINLVPDMGCVRVGEKVILTLEKNSNGINPPINSRNRSGMKLEMVEAQVVRTNMDNPAVVGVQVVNDDVELEVMAESLTRHEKMETGSADDIVWDWFCGLTKIKNTINMCELETGAMPDRYRRRLNDETKIMKDLSPKERGSVHRSVLASGEIFSRVFIGSKWNSCKVIPNCYIRAHEDLSQIVVAPISAIEQGYSHLYRELSTVKNLVERSRRLSIGYIETKSKLLKSIDYSSVNGMTSPILVKDMKDSIKFSGLASPSIGGHTPHVMSPSGSTGAPNSETFQLFNFSSKVQEESKVERQIQQRIGPVALKGANERKPKQTPRHRPNRKASKKGKGKSKVKSPRAGSNGTSPSAGARKRKHHRKHSEYGSRRKMELLSNEELKPRRMKGFFLEKKQRNVRVFDTKDMEILQDHKCPAFYGCHYALGLKFKRGPNQKETVVSFECQSLFMVEYWFRHFRYLKEVNGPISIPVRTRAGFRMQSDLKWQGSFEEHFEFYCPKKHNMEFKVVEPEKARQFKCHNCNTMAKRNTLFFHVCPVKKCGYQMCTVCAKRTSIIGTGAFSEVHLAINKNLSNKPPCVIKIFKNVWHKNLKKMVMETDTLFRLQAHPNVVKYQGYGGPNANGQLWIVMECCEAGSVLDLRNSMSTLLAESHIAYILHCVLRALKFLHEKKIAHKDIKAANILLTIQGFVKLSDFGIAEQVKETKEGKMLEFAGTPAWMPPEVFMGEQATERGDIWALGITAIELAEGKAPCQDNLELEAIALKIALGPPPRLQDKSKLDKPPRKQDSRNWSTDFKGFLAKTLIRDVEYRPTASQLLRDRFMDEERFKLTSFCKHMLSVMREAGIFELEQMERDRLYSQSSVPALICRKSLLHLIQYGNYKEAEEPGANDGDRKMITIQDRLYGGDKRRKEMLRKNQKKAEKDNLTKDIKEWGFMKMFADEESSSIIKSSRTKVTAPAKSEKNEIVIDFAGLDNRRNSNVEVSVTPMLDLGDCGDMTATRHIAGSEMPVIQAEDGSGDPAHQSPDDDVQEKNSGGNTLGLPDMPAFDLGNQDMTLTQGGILPDIPDRKTVTKEPAEEEGQENQNTKETKAETKEGENGDSVKPGNAKTEGKIATQLPFLSPDKKFRGRKSMKYFLKNTDQTFQFHMEKNVRFFSTKNVQIDTEGRLKTARTGARKIHNFNRSDLIHIRELDRGASGRVLKSYHIPTRKFYALKEIKIDESKLRHQLDKELMAFNQVQGVNVVSLVGAYLEKGAEKIVIVLEYMDCGSLEHMITKKKSFPEKYLAQVALQACLGVQHIHNAKFIHRDIKPDNFLVQSNGTVKVADFGLMKELRDASGAWTKNGTMWYLSPERFEGKHSYPADIWAVGLTLYIAATGEMPYPRDYWSLVSAMQEKPSPALDKKTFSKEACDFISKCLKKNPSERWTALQLLNHPFIQKACSKKELGAWLLDGTFEKRKEEATRDLQLLAREIRLNREGKGSEIFVNLKYMGQIASLYGMKGGELANVIEEAWRDAEKISLDVEGRRSYEFWRPDADEADQ